MKVIADTHLHFYPCYDEKVFFNSFNNNLLKLSNNRSVKRVGFLVERFDCDFFERFISESERFQGVVFEEVSERGILKGIVRNAPKETAEFYLVAGRQVVTLEKIEVLALAIDSVIPDGDSLVDTWKSVLVQGGVPVLPWAPGKWLFKRGRIIREFLLNSGSAGAFLGDSPVRPGFCPKPPLFRFFEEKGVGVLAGSDPLPFPGEEKQAGTFGTFLEGEWDDDSPLVSLKEMLLSCQGETKGGRNSWFQAAKRLYGHHRYKKIEKGLNENEKNIVY